PAPPELMVRPPERRALRPAQPLVLPVRCSAPCDVRAHLPGDEADDDVTGTLTRPGTLRLRFRARGKGIVPAGDRPLQVTISYGSPGARAVRTGVKTAAPQRLA